MLQAAPKELSSPVKEIGGVRDWLWKGEEHPTATIEAIVHNEVSPAMPLRHQLSFTEHGNRFELVEERIENEKPYGQNRRPYFYYRYEFGHPTLKERTSANQSDSSSSSSEEADEERTLRRDTVSPEQSILSQVKDPERYPVLSYLQAEYSSIAMFREWTFGRYTAPRFGD